MIHVYTSGQKKNRVVCEAFAAGAKAPIVGPYPLRDGAMFTYGCLRGLLPALRQAQQEGRDWYYADNGYFKSPRIVHNDELGYYRVTKNAMQHDGTGTHDSKRWTRLGMAIQAWRRNGTHVLVCPAARILAVVLGFDPDQWLEDTLRTLREHTDRPLRIRAKMSHMDVKRGLGTPLEADLSDCWALVTHSSNVAVDALLAGVPVFCTAPCAGYLMGTPDLSRIEEPLIRDGREQLAWNLAANQWSLAEMRSGLCWRELQTR